MRNLIIFYFLISPFICFAEDTIPKQNINSVNIVDTSKGFDLFASGSVGMTTGSTWDDWEGIFNLGPVMALGLELPFTKSHMFAFQLYEFTAFSKKNENQINHSDVYGTKYKNLSTDYIYQMYYSGVIKCYLSSNIKSP